MNSKITCSIVHLHNNDFYNWWGHQSAFTLTWIAYVHSLRVNEWTSCIPMLLGRTLESSFTRRPYCGILSEIPNIFWVGTFGYDVINNEWYVQWLVLEGESCHIQFIDTVIYTVQGYWLNTLSNLVSRLLNTPRKCWFTIYIR